MGVPNRTAIIQDWAHQSFISCFFYLPGKRIQVSPKESKGPVSLCANIANMCIASGIICYYSSKVFHAFNMFKVCCKHLLPLHEDKKENSQKKKNKTHAKPKKTSSRKLRSKLDTIRTEIKTDVRKQHDLC